MTRLLAATALVLAAALAPSAQTTDSVHTFQVRDGAIYLDGQPVSGAIPEGLDLSDENTQVMEFSGPIMPVVEVDGQVYVFENRRLVLLSESSQAGQGVYIRNDVMPDPGMVAEMPQERVTPIVEQAYLRDVASRNADLFGQMQRAQSMEREVERRASRIRAMPPSAERRGLEGELRGLLSDLLTLKHQIRAQEIDVASERLDAARRGLSEREEHHDEMVDGRLRELIGGQ